MSAVEPHLLVRVEGGVGVATLNRPERRNALSAEMVTALADVLRRWDADDEIGAVVLTGAGAGFCAGGDVKGFAERGGEAGGATLSAVARIDRQRANQRATTGALAAFGKPTVAALPGPAAGAGLGLALACDVRIGCDRSALVPAFAAVGLPGDYGVAWLLHHLAGPLVARRMLLLGERLDAAEANALGLIDRVVEASDVQSTALNVARGLADGPRHALHGIKANLRDARTFDLLAAMDREVPRHQACGATDDHREAVAAFVEKRPPRFGRNRPPHDIGPEESGRGGTR